MQSRLVNLEQILNFRTGKLDSNRAVSNGIYPFFTCAPETFSINEYAFDDEAVLLAGNNANGIYPVKYYKGKFNAYQRTYVITPKKTDEVSVRWLYFAMTKIAQDLKEFSVGSATKFLTKQILNTYEINLPSFSDQENIADVLWSLEIKIELNQRMNKTLETIAQMLFKSWFVDFDPVKAKAEGRKPESMDDATAALFPSNFTESSLGLIPEEWEVTTVEEIAQLVAMGPFGSSIKVSTFVSEGVPVISGQHLKNG